MIRSKMITKKVSRTHSTSCPCVVMRGGTSRGLFFYAQDIPESSELRDQMLMASIGGPDPRQVDGLGGADLLLSKVAIVAPSSRPEIDIDCTFFNIPPGKGAVAKGANCGNLMSAVGLFAIEEGIVTWKKPTTLVRMYNTDSDTVVEGLIADPKLRTAELDNLRTSGMPTSGAWVDLGFLRPLTTVQDRLLPTGNSTDRVDLPDGRSVQVSIVDSGALYVFVRAKDLALDSTITAGRIHGDPELMATLEHIRGNAAALVGLVDSPQEALIKTPTVPKLAIVGPPASYKLEGHETSMDADTVDMVGCIISCQKFHKAYAVTGAIATASAAVVSGSVVEQLTGSQERSVWKTVRIGHPTGVIACRVQYHEAAGQIVIERAEITRTARRIIEGTIFIPLPS